ncbi:uncharacterized protein [Prorops nasuta]|uniref:uncharacterized protein n=1 Tax=Prorops nasuta TaxID=863751 RepID=UPI0034CE1C00
MATVIEANEIKSFSVPISSPDEDQITNILEVLSKHTWNIFGVSCLYGFETTEVQLKLYAKKINEEISNTLKQEDVSYKAKISVLEDIASILSPVDPPGIMIEVSAKTIGREKDIVKTIYKGIMLSWKTTHSTVQTGNAVRLPLLLCSGSKSCINAVHNTINHLFDCMIIALPAKQDDLMWLTLIILVQNEEESSSKKSLIKLKYIVPELSPMDTITTKFDFAAIITMLNAVTDYEENDSTLEIVLNVYHIEKFFGCLHDQMMHTAGLQLGLCTLNRIDLPSASVMENKVKVLSLNTMHRVLLYFNEKAIAALHAQMSGSYIGTENRMES